MPLSLGSVSRTDPLVRGSAATPPRRHESAARRQSSTDDLPGRRVAAAIGIPRSPRGTPRSSGTGMPPDSRYVRVTYSGWKVAIASGTFTSITSISPNMFQYILNFVYGNKSRYRLFRWPRRHPRPPLAGPFARPGRRPGPARGPRRLGPIAVVAGRGGQRGRGGGVRGLSRLSAIRANISRRRRAQGNGLRVATARHRLLVCSTAMQRAIKSLEPIASCARCHASRARLSM